MEERRLIDANELVDKVRTDWGLTHQSQLISAATKLSAADAMCKLLGEVAKTPTIDAVQVVRCNDCKHHRNAGCPMRSLHVATHGYAVQDNTTDNGFCHMGAKMEGGEDHC